MRVHGKKPLATNIDRKASSSCRQLSHRLGKTATKQSRLCSTTKVVFLSKKKTVLLSITNSFKVCLLLFLCISYCFYIYIFVFSMV